MQENDYNRSQDTYNRRQYNYNRRQYNYNRKQYNYNRKQYNYNKGIDGSTKTADTKIQFDPRLNAESFLWRNYSALIITLHNTTGLHYDTIITSLAYGLPQNSLQLVDMAQGSNVVQIPDIDKCTRANFAPVITALFNVTKPHLNKTNEQKGLYQLF